MRLLKFNLGGESKSPRGLKTRRNHLAKRGGRPSIALRGLFSPGAEETG